MTIRKRRFHVLLLIWGSLVTGLALLPLLGLPEAWYRSLIFAYFTAIFAMSWDLLGGVAGQVNLGHALFVGVAAYTSGLFSVYLSWSPLVTILLGTLAAGLVGALFGVPAVRLRGPYLALVTLIALIAVYKLVLIYSNVTGGLSGLYFTPQSFFPPLGYDVPLSAVRRITYYYALGLMTVVGLLLLWTAHSRWGQIFSAIRENETAVEAAGLSPAKFKIAAFMLSALAAGLGGAAYVHLPVLPVLQPGGLDGVLSLDLSLMIIVAAVVGGLGTIVGPAIGAFFTELGQQYLSELPVKVEALQILAGQGQGWITLVFLLLLIALVIFAPHGLLPTLLGWTRTTNRR
jgi:branched-chain amino acid transport system permease protein